MNKESEKLCDLALAKRLQTGDMDALTLIYDRHSRCVRYYCTRVVKNEKVAEELTHDVFVKVLTRIGQFNPDREGSSLGKWITTIAVTTSLNYMKRESKRRDRELIALERRNARVGNAPPAEQELSQKEFTNACWEAIKKLPELTRQCFVCHHVLGIKQVDLCRIYGLYHHQLTNRLAVARHRLAQELRPYV